MQDEYLDIVVLEKEHIYLIHEQVIEEFGGSIEVYNNTDAKIESILSQQYPCFGFDKYPTVYEKASMLMYFFTKNHCFVDGNKRVGFGVANVFLLLNEIELTMSNDEAERMVMEIAESELRNEEIDHYIKKLSLKLEYKSIDV
jgi:death-on-curing protein